ncbi:MAG: hypothetical protein MEQ07_12335 [Aquimonas sp.]|nr:hypothetical protein [Aquimonas sp.]
MFISKLIKGMALAGLLLPAVAIGQGRLQAPEPNNIMFVSGENLVAVTPEAVMSWNLISGRGVISIKKVGEFDLKFGPAAMPKSDQKIVFLSGDYAKAGGCQPAINAAISAIDLPGDSRTS